MRDLDFNPYKSTDDFRKNYKLHDLAEKRGKNLLTQWGIYFKDFGEDNRYQKVWEKGQDKPDLLLHINNKIIFLDWKSKRKPRWLLNKRAYDSYLSWSKKYSADVIIVFFIFTEEEKMADKRFAIIGLHRAKQSEKKQWDKNITIEFEDDLPIFNKANLVNLLTNE